MEKYRNCKKDIYFRNKILHSLGLQKAETPHHIYHSHNHSMNCDDGTYTSAEREGKCVHCGFLVIQDYNSIYHLFSLFDRVFRRCKCNNPELSSPKVESSDLSGAWRQFTRRLR